MAPRSMARALLLSLAVFASSGAAQESPGGTAVTLALAGGRLLDGYGGLPVENAVVLIAGDRIAAAGEGL